MGDMAFAWLSKILFVTLSICEAKYVATSTCMSCYLAIRWMLKNLKIIQEATKIYVDKSLLLHLQRI